MGLMSMFRGDKPHRTYPVQTEPPRVGKSFDASNLRVEGLACELVVEPWDQRAVGTHIEANEDRAKAITFTVVGRTLIIRDTWKSSSVSVVRNGGQTVINHGGVGRQVNVTGGSSITNVWVGGRQIIAGTVRGGSICLDGDSITIDGVDVTEAAGNAPPEPPAKLTVRVPRGAYIALEGLFRDATVGDVEGQVYISASGGGDVTCGRVRSASIDIFGSSDVSIAEVTEGPVVVKVQGSGDVEVGGGTIDNLSVSVMGSGDVEIGATVVNARLAVMGSGDIYVARVRWEPVVSRMGSGKVSVGRIG